MTSIIANIFLTIQINSVTIQRDWRTSRYYTYKICNTQFRDTTKVESSSAGFIRKNVGLRPILYRNEA